MQARRTKALRRVALWLLGMALTAVQAQTTTVAGTTPTQFSVNETGAATYRIPIQVPPGVAGMEPKLELAYNSQGGNGLLGIGWSLGGLSAVTRCSKIMAADGVRAGIQLDTTDRFCLDGAKLILAAGTYGGNDSVYRTELDSFSLVTALGGDNSATAGYTGPQSFKVQTKAGLTLEFGTTVDSRIEAQGKSTVLMWALSKVTDVKGNALTVAYSESNASGSFEPVSIAYAGGSASVVFSYEARTDIQPRYVKSSVVRLDKRLTGIKTYFNGNLVKDYQMAFEASPSTARSRLVSVKECAGAAGLCLAPVNFSYDDSTSEVWNQNWSAHGNQADGWAFADLFGDGRKVYWTRQGGIHYATAFNPDGTVQNWQWSGGHGTGADGWEMADLFGDGRQVYWAHSGAQHYATRLNSDGTSQSWTWSAHGVGSDGWKLVDLFGDGRKVYWTHTGSQHFATRFNPDGTSQSWTWSGSGVGEHWQFADVFGDGRQVYWTHSGGTHSFTRLNQDGTSESWERAGHGVHPDGWQFGDLFGDGRQVFWTHSGGTHFATALTMDRATQAVTAQSWEWAGGQGVHPDGWQLADLFGDGRQVYWTRNGGTHLGTRLNPDGTSQSWTWAGGHGTGSDGWQLVDLFGDGRKVYWARSGNNHYATRLNSDGTTQNWTWVAFGTLDRWQMADLFGDGRQVYWAQTGGSHYVSQFGRGAFDTMKSARMGTNPGQQVTHKTLLAASLSGGYTKDTGGSAAVYPKVDMQFPMYVVSSVDSNNGIGGVLTTQYSYGGLKAEQGTGRGMLGFRWMKSRSVANNIESYTEFNQNWPLTGSVAKSETRLAGSGNAGLLKRTSNSYAQGPGSSTGTTFVYPSQSVEESWDLGGTPYPTVTTSYQYGQSPQYGDPTQISVSNSAGAGKTTVNQYWPANTTGGSWVLGRLARAVVTSTGPDTTDVPVPPTPVPPAVTLASISPASGPSTGGTPFSVTGSGFAAGAVVRIGGVAASACVVASSTMVNCTLPANSAGAKDVVLTLGSASAALTGGFTYHTALVIGANTSNYNLAQALGNPTQALTAIVTINPGVTVYAASTGQPAFSTGSLPAGSLVQIINKGSIIGAGGAGGGGGSARANGDPGSIGGTALDLTVNASIDNTSGNIFGGGGGGGGGAGSFTYIPNFDTAGGGGAGGGAGFVGGTGGSGGSPGNGGPRGSYGANGSAGSSSGGGSGGAGFDLNSAYAQGAGWGGNGGGGGAYGTSGAAGGAGYSYDGSYNVVSSGGSPGAAGNAVKLNAHTLTWLGGNNATQLKGPVN